MGIYCFILNFKQCCPLNFVTADIFRINIILDETLSLSYFEQAYVLLPKTAGLGGEELV